MKPQRMNLAKILNVDLDSIGGTEKRREKQRPLDIHYLAAAAAAKVHDNTLQMKVLQRSRREAREK